MDVYDMELSGRSHSVLSAREPGGDRELVGRYGTLGASSSAASSFADLLRVGSTL